MACCKVVVDDEEAELFPTERAEALESELQARPRTAASSIRRCGLGNF